MAPACQGRQFPDRIQLQICTHPEATHDVAEVIRSLDDDMTHNQIIEETMCCFSGIPSTAAAINKLHHIRQQPGENLWVYINKWKELYWLCTEKLPKHKLYKMAVSSFCSSLQDPISKKLCEKLLDEWDQWKVLTLKLCFSKTINPYKKYWVNEHRGNLEIMENLIEINETSSQKPNYSGNRNYNKNYNQGGSSSGHNYNRNTCNKGINTKPKCKLCFGPTEVYNIHQLLNEHAASCANQARMVESTTKFFKERTGKAAQINKIELEALAEMHNHQIELVIEEINLYDFPQLDNHQTCIWLGDLKQGYNPEQYYKDISSNSKVHEIYTATISYNTDTTFPITINGLQSRHYWTLVQKGVAWK